MLSENDRTRMLRRAKSSFSNEGLSSAEFLRWFDLSGVARSRPLDEDELVKLLVGHRGVSISAARREVKEKSLARKGDKALWLQAQNPVVDRIIALMKDEIEKYGLDVLRRYPDDLYVFDRNTLMMHAASGARLAWTVYDGSTRLIPLGLHRKINEGVTYGTKASSSQRFYELRIGASDFSLKEVGLRNFEALFHVPVPYLERGGERGFSLMKGDICIGSVSYESRMDGCSPVFKVVIIPRVGISSLDRAALSAWASQGAIERAHTLFCRTETIWQENELSCLVA